jgi:hypothetical protein
MRRAALAICLVAAAQLHADEPGSPVDLPTVLHRAGERVERFFLRAQSLICLEIVRLQSLTSGWSIDGPGRVVESELRLSWDAEDDGSPSTEAQTLRRLLKVNGREPRKNDWNNCTTPEQQSQEPQPLSLLLPGKQSEYSFALAGATRLDGRPAIQVDYRLMKDVSVESQTVGGRDDCISFELEGGLRGRLWIDAETYDVLRLDQRLTGMVEIPLPREVTRRAGAPRSWTMERWDTSIRFKAVRFENPDETLVLPASLSSLRVTRGSGTPRLRTNTDYKNYQRFLTAGRVVGE